MSIEKEVRIRSWGEIITQPKFMVTCIIDLQIYVDCVGYAADVDDNDDDDDNDYRNDDDDADDDDHTPDYYD